MTTKKTKRPSHVHRDFGPLLNPKHRPAKSAPHVTLEDVKERLTVILDRATHVRGLLTSPASRGEILDAVESVTVLERQVRHLRKVRWCRQIPPLSKKDERPR